MVVFIFFISGYVQSQSKKQTLEYFKDNYSYKWDRIDSEIAEDLIESCKNHYKKKGEFGDAVDVMRLKRAYRVKYEDNYYLILEFDFIDIFDYRIDYVIREDNTRMTGTFYRSLA